MLRGQMQGVLMGLDNLRQVAEPVTTLSNFSEGSEKIGANIFAILKW